MSGHVHTLLMHCHAPQNPKHAPYSLPSPCSMCHDLFKKTVAMLANRVGALQK